MIREEKNSLYKCHFCQQNIDVYDIEKHFSTFHKFKSSIESEYVCEFCDDFEEFHSQTDLFHHIQNAHNLVNDEEIQPTTITNVDTLEEGKSRFLQFILNFNSQEDVLNLLQWIKYNDNNTFMSNHCDMKNENFDTNRFMKNHYEIENEVLVVENVSKTTEDNDEKILHEDIDNSDSNSIIEDLDQGTDAILTQTDTNIFNTKHHGTENQLPFVEENMRLTNEENDTEILLQDMDNAHSNSVDFDQETDVILTSREIFQEGIEDKTEVVEKPKYTTHQESFSEKGKTKENITRVCETFKCNSCVKLFSHQQSLKRHIRTVHESYKDYKCKSCGKSFTQAGHLKRHINGNRQH